MAFSRLSSYLTRLPWAQGFAMATIALFVLMLALSFLLPILWDDIWYPITSGRVGYDNGMNMNAYPQCGKSFLTATPLTLMPGRWLSWIVHALTADFIALRFVAICILLAAMGFMSFLIRRFVLTALPWYMVLSLVVACTAIGSMPFSFLMARPEAAMLLSIAICCYFPLATICGKAKPTHRAHGAALLVFVPTVSWLLSSHPKAMLYAPLILVSAASLCHWGRRSGLAILGFSIVCIAQAWGGFWRYKLDCSGSPTAQAVLDAQQLSPAYLLTDPVDFLKSFILNIATVYEHFYAIANYERMIFSLGVLNHIAYALLPAVVAALSIGMAWTLLCLFSLMRRMLHEPAMRRNPLALACLCVYAAGIAQVGLQTDKKFYALGMVWLSMLLASLIVRCRLCAHPLRMPSTRPLYIVICSLSLYIQTTTMAIFYPAMVHLALHTDRDGVILGTIRSIVAHNYDERQRNVRAAAATCKIPTHADARHLLIDAYTYMPLKHTFQPLQVEFSFQEFSTPAALYALMEHWGSSGLVMYCRNIPIPLRHLTSSYRGICCISGQSTPESGTP